jgi:hypothetical protein
MSCINFAKINQVDAFTFESKVISPALNRFTQ